jgi:hypothetical protein
VDTHAVTLAWAKHVTPAEGKEWDDPDVAVLSLQNALKDARAALDAATALLPPKPAVPAAPGHPAIPGGGVVTAPTSSTGPLTASTTGAFGS